MFDRNYLKSRLAALNTDWSKIPPTEKQLETIENLLDQLGDSQDRDISTKNQASEYIEELIERIGT